MIIDDREHYFTGLGHKDSDDIIYFPKILGLELGLKEDSSFVHVEELTGSIPNCSSCCFSLLRHHGSIDFFFMKDRLSNHILDRLRVVYHDMVFPFVYEDEVLYFRISSINPASQVAFLVQNSEITFDHENYDSSQRPKVINLYNWFGSFFNPSTSEDEVDGAQIKYITIPTVDYRFHSKVFNVSTPSEMLPEVKALLNTVWVHPKDLSTEHWLTVAVLHKLLSKSEKVKRRASKNSDNSKKISLSFILDDEAFLSTCVQVRPSEKCPPNQVIVSENLAKLMDLCLNSKVSITKTDLQITQNKVAPTSTVSFYPLDSSSDLSREFIKATLKDYVEEHDYLIAANRSFLFLSGHRFFVTSDPCTSYFDRKSLKNIRIDVKAAKVPISFTTKWGKSLPLAIHPDIAGIITNENRFGFYSSETFIPWMHNELEKVIGFLKLIFGSNTNLVHSLFSKSLLVCGPSKSGKSSFLKYVIEKFEKQYPSKLYVRTIKCSEWKSMTKLKSSWQEAFEDCLFYQPSVLIVDGLDLVACKINREEEGFGTETTASLRVSYFFASLVRSLSHSFCKFGSKLAIIATATSEDTLNPFLAPMTGECIFYDTIHMPSPDTVQRKTILERLLRGKSNDLVPDFISSSILRKAYGFSFSDLKNLVDLANHRSISKNRELSQSDLIEVLKTFTPQFMQGVKTELRSCITFTDIGGLRTVKKALTEAILQPLRFPILFSKCPIRPPQNVLLYGPPGTGKSLIVEALTNESGIQMIRVRGPELLSKYIGRSEERVRLLFEKARKIKPCIVFFDEFEALATRRGQDTTGVTDRVVNQLLVQMDGVETADREIFVIATTSRPDMIDPALLRPGRLDKSLRFDFPDAEERLEIWKVLSSKLQFSEVLDDSMIKEITENYTGADIRALLINSKHQAIDEVIGDCADSGPILISKSHVLEASKKTPLLFNGEKREEYQQL